MNIIKFKKKKIQTEDKRTKELREELMQAKDAIALAYANLANVVDKDMIDCCIFEINARELRYKVLLNQMKNEEARACMTLKKNS